MAVGCSHKPTRSTARLKVAFLGTNDQAWRCREESTEAPIESLPEYLSCPTSLTTNDSIANGGCVAGLKGVSASLDRVATVAKASEVWQRSLSLLVVAMHSASLFHGGDRFARRLKQARKVRRVWGHVPSAVVPFLLSMSAPERVVGCAIDEDVETFTQSAPAVVEGSALPAEIEAAQVIVRQASGRRALEIMEGSYLDALGYLRMMCAPKKRAWPDASCRRRRLPPELCGRTIPVAYQKRLMLMLVLGHASSLSFNNGGRHRLITFRAPASAYAGSGDASL